MHTATNDVTSNLMTRAPFGSGQAASQRALNLGLAALGALAPSVGAARGMSNESDPANTSRPFFFEQNMGQADPAFDFVARGPGYTLGLSPTEAVMAVQMPDSGHHRFRDIAQLTLGAKSALLPNGRRIGEVAPNPADAPMVRMQIVGGNTEAPVTGVDPLVTKINYFIGDDPSQWYPRVSTFAQVQYDDVYPGIDLAYYGRGHNLEYDFIVSPGADSSRIALSFSGADAVSTDNDGNLVLQVGNTQIRQNAPYIYQEINGTRQEVAGSFQISTEHATVVTFDIGAYDYGRPLVIDPMVLGYSTYLGGPSSDYAYGVDVDQVGSAYVTGAALSGFPLVNPTFSYTGGGDAFVSKFSADGSTLLYSTYIGGTYEDQADSIAVDGKGNAYVTGYTLSGNFPSTAGVFQPNNGDGSCNGNTDCSDAFIAKIGGSDGASLLYSTYLGGVYAESGEGIAVDSLGNAYVMGQTDGVDFPVQNPIQGYGGGLCDGLPCFDDFVTKLNSTGSALVYSTYLGGNREEAYFFHQTGDIAVDTVGHAYITGYTDSSTFPIYNAIDPTRQGREAFATKLGPDGSSFVYSTFLGGYPGDRGRGIAADGAGNAYVGGLTCADDFPTTPDSFKPTKSGGGTNCDGFVSKLTPDGSAFVFSTFFGGSSEEEVTSIATDSVGNAYVAGFTYSVDFPTKQAFQSTNSGGFADGFVSKLSGDGRSLVYSSYLGGVGSEGAFGLAIDNKENAFVTGNTDSADFPTVKAFQPEKGGIGPDAFVTKVSSLRREIPVLYQP